MAGEMSHLPDNANAAGAAGDGQQGGGTIQYLHDKLKQSAHPTVIIFHLLFKTMAFFLYIFGGWFVGGKSSSQAGAHFIALTVVCILLLAADFWVVKNVTGRLLVGLRWWNKVDDDSTTWIFEAAEDKPVNAFDRNVFWFVLYGTPVVWSGLLVLGVLKFQLSWLMIVVIALSLSVANVYGYYKCSKDQKAKFQRMIQRGAEQGAMAMVRSSMLGMLTGNNRGGGGGSGTYV